MKNNKENEVDRVYEVCEGTQRVWKLARPWNCVEKLGVPLIKRSALKPVLAEGEARKLVAVAGRGAFGVVLKAWFTCGNGSMQKPAVVKHFHRAVGPSREEVLREAQFLLHLQGTDAVPDFFGILEHSPVESRDSRPCLVQSFFGNGVTLGDVLEDFISLTEEDRHPVALQLALGLLAIHKKRVALNDIKEANVLIDLERDPKAVRYIDTGLAAHCSVLRRWGKEEAAHIERYAPEVRAGGRMGQEGDVYTLGWLIAKLNMCTRFPSLVRASKLCMMEDPAERNLAQVVEELRHS
ncbi:hypothetical protein ACOMHN_012596 [Nucella lapillus]